MQLNPDRTWSVRTRFETRADEGVGLIVGLAAVFNKPTEIWPGLIEEVDPHAFDDAISQDDVRALFNHDPNLVLGRSTSGTLRLSTDQIGLRYEIDVDLNNPQVHSVYRMIDRRDVTQSSFGFDYEGGAEEWIWPADDTQPIIHKINKVGHLWDVSPVTFPAFPDTDADARTRDTILRSLAVASGEKLEELKKLEPAQIRSLFGPKPVMPERPPRRQHLDAAYRALNERRYLR